MADIGSLRYNVIKLRRLIYDYINNSISNAGYELRNMKIDCNDFVDALDNLNIKTDKEIAEYERITTEYDDLLKDHKELDKKYEELLSSLELITQDPFIKSIEKTNDLIKIIKEKTSR
jgi:hypothetical protein